MKDDELHDFAGWNPDVERQNEWVRKTSLVVVTIHIGGDDDRSVMLDDVYHVHRHALADDLALRPFPDRSLAPKFTQLIIDYSIICERRHQAIDIKRVGSSDEFGHWRWNVWLFLLRHRQSRDFILRDGEATLQLEELSGSNRGRAATDYDRNCGHHPAFEQVDRMDHGAWGEEKRVVPGSDFLAVVSPAQVGQNGILGKCCYQGLVVTRPYSLDERVDRLG